MNAGWLDTTRPPKLGQTTAGIGRATETKESISMRLYVRLFYILWAVFIMGIILVCVVDSSSVLSRVGSGLITGSFVGLITTFSNYYHLRQTYFEKLVSLIMEAQGCLGDDYIDAKSHIAFISEMSKQELIRFYSGEEMYKSTQEDVKEMKLRYANLASRFDFESFVPLIPFGEKKLCSVLEEMEDLIGHQLGHLYGEYLLCFGFRMLSVEVSKEEQDLALGDLNAFFEQTVQDNVDFRDKLAFHLNSLANQSESLLQLTKRSFSKLYADLLGTSIEMTRKGFLKDAIIRDVYSENAARIEGEYSLDEDDDKEELPHNTYESSFPSLAEEENSL